MAGSGLSTLMLNTMTLGNWNGSGHKGGNDVMCGIGETLVDRQMEGEMGFRTSTLYLLCICKRLLEMPQYARL